MSDALMRIIYFDAPPIATNTFRAAMARANLHRPH
jgi:hypothetical protein